MPGNFANSQNLVTIKDIRRDTLILKDGSLRRIILVGGVNFSLKSDQEQNMLIGAYQNFLNSVDFSLQILIHSRKINIDRYLEELGQRLEQEPSPLLQSQISEYREFVRQFVSENAIMQKMFLVVVPWHPLNIPKPSKSGFKLPFFGKKNKPGAGGKEGSAQDAAGKKSAEEGAAAGGEGGGDSGDGADEDTEKMLNDNLPQLEQRVTQVQSGLVQAGLDVQILKSEELAELFFNYYNPGTVERQDMPLTQTGPPTKS
jgi:hypothetical protein